MIEETIGARLRRARIARGETIQQVAAATHSSPASFSAWENDHSLPSDRSLRKLSNYYGVDLRSPDPLLGAAGESTTITAIRIESLLTPQTYLTFNGTPLTAQQKALLASFAIALVLTQLSSTEV